MGVSGRLDLLLPPGNPAKADSLRTQCACVLIQLVFKSRRTAPKTLKGPDYRSLHCFGQTGFEPATPSPPDLYAKPLRHCPSTLSCSTKIAQQAFYVKSIVTLLKSFHFLVFEGGLYFTNAHLFVRIIQKPLIRRCLQCSKETYCFSFSLPWPSVR